MAHQPLKTTMLSETPGMHRGVDCARFFIDGFFSMKNRGLDVQNLWLFLIHYELSENQIFCFSMVILGYLEDVGKITPNPLKPSP